jgi:hypothetical protein
VPTSLDACEAWVQSLPTARPAVRASAQAAARLIHFEFERVLNMFRVLISLLLGDVMSLCTANVLFELLPAPWTATELSVTCV